MVAGAGCAAMSRGEFPGKIAEAAHGGAADPAEAVPALEPVGYNSFVAGMIGAMCQR